MTSKCWTSRIYHCVKAFIYLSHFKLTSTYRKKNCLLTSEKAAALLLHCKYPYPKLFLQLIELFEFVQSKLKLPYWIPILFNWQSHDQVNCICMQK